MNHIHKIISEIDEAYKLCKDLERKLKEYNEKAAEQDLPNIFYPMGKEYDDAYKKYKQLLILHWPKIRKALK